MDPAKLAKLQALAASNRIGEYFFPCAASVTNEEKKNHYQQYNAYNSVYALLLSHEQVERGPFAEKLCGRPSPQRPKMTKNYKAHSRN